MRRIILSACCAVALAALALPFTYHSSGSAKAVKSIPVDRAARFVKSPIELIKAEKQGDVTTLTYKNVANYDIDCIAFVAPSMSLLLGKDTISDKSIARSSLNKPYLIKPGETHTTSSEGFKDDETISVYYALGVNGNGWALGQFVKRFDRKTRILPDGKAIHDPERGLYWNVDMPTALAARGVDRLLPATVKASTKPQDNCYFLFAFEESQCGFATCTAMLAYMQLVTIGYNRSFISVQCINLLGEGCGYTLSAQLGGACGPG